VLVRFVFFHLVRKFKDGQSFYHLMKFGQTTHPVSNSWIKIYVRDVSSNITAINSSIQMLKKQHLNENLLNPNYDMIVLFCACIHFI